MVEVATDGDTSSQVAEVAQHLLLPTGIKTSNFTEHVVMVNNKGPHTASQKMLDLD